MNQKSDPTCSHDFKSSDHQKASLEIDKVVPSNSNIVSGEKKVVEDDIPKADDTISGRQAPLQEYFENEPSVIIISDKRIVEHQSDDKIADDKSENHDQNISLITDVLVTQNVEPQADDTRSSHQAHLYILDKNIFEPHENYKRSLQIQLYENNKGVPSIKDVLYNQIIEHQGDDPKTSHPKQLLECNIEVPPSKYLVNNNQIAEPTELDDNRSCCQATIKKYVADILADIDVLDKQAVGLQTNNKIDYNKSPELYRKKISIMNESYKQIVEPRVDNPQCSRQQEYNKDDPTDINVLHKQNVDPQTDNKKGECKSKELDVSVTDKLFKPNFDPQENDKRSGQHEYDKDIPQDKIVSGNHNEDLTPKVFRIASTLSNIEIIKAHHSQQQAKENPSILLRSTATQLRILSNLPSPMSINILPNQPQSLFLLALSKLNESAISFAVNTVGRKPDSSLSRAVMVSDRAKSPELSPPGSLGSAPPSYSFVLRQMAVRRRPRIFGTFVPSPSFIQHTPPPTYTASFDIYLDNIPPPPTRVYNFGFAPMLVVCPDCGFTGMTQVTSKITLCTHLCAITLCIMCCWICVPLPYVMRSCKDVYHYCRNCRSFLGTYCPTNPENVTIR